MSNRTTSIHSLEDKSALARWHALWETSSQRSAFSSLAYTVAAARAYRLRCAMHLAEQDGEAAAGALVFWRKRGPYREAVIPPFTPYTPVVLAHPLKEADVPARRSPLEALLAALEERYHVVRLFCPALADVRPASWRGWQTTPYYSYHLDLDPEEDLLRSWSSSRRHHYRKNREIYDVVEDPGRAQDLVRFVTESYRRHDREPPAPPSRLHTLVESLIEHGLVRLWAATPRRDEAPEGVIGIAHDGRTAGYWLGGSVPGPAMTVLLGTVLTQLQKEGYALFDFVGANTPSIAVFKRQFGGDLTTYYYLEKITRPELRLLRRLKGP